MMRGPLNRGHLKIPMNISQLSPLRPIHKLRIWNSRPSDSVRFLSLRGGIPKSVVGRMETMLADLRARAARVCWCKVHGLHH